MMYTQILGYKLRTLNRYNFTALKTEVKYNILFDDDIRIFYFECLHKNTICKHADIDNIYVFNMYLSFKRLSH